MSMSSLESSNNLSLSSARINVFQVTGLVPCPFSHSCKVLSHFSTIEEGSDLSHIIYTKLSRRSNKCPNSLQSRATSSMMRTSDFNLEGNDINSL